MKNQSFMTVEITLIKTIGDTKEKLEEVRKIGDANEKDEVLTGQKYNC